MTEIIHSNESSTSGWSLLCVGVVAWLLLLSGAVNAAKSHQESGASPALVQEQGSVYSIAVGPPVAREMRGGEEHLYEVKLSAGQYARVVLEQKGIDVVLVLLGADGKPLLEVDNNLSGTRGLEVVSLLAEVSGAYLVHVRSLQKDAAAGRYEVRIEDLRVATEADRTRITAERSYFAAAQLQGERTAEQRRKANEEYAEALRLMRAGGGQRGAAN